MRGLHEVADSGDAEAVHDALDLTKYRTVADDPECASGLTAERTAGVAVVEDALYDDSAVSILDGRDLVPFWGVAGVLDDGSGGGYSQARIKEQLERLSRALALINVLAIAAGKVGPVRAPASTPAR